jgi:protein O-mannosyl-transferase
LGDCGRPACGFHFQLLLTSRFKFHPLLAAVLIAAAILLTYRNAYDGPFVFDDRATILENPTIRRLWPLGEVLSPPSDRGLTVNGRPLVNATLALNYALGGTNPRGYHVFNVLIHIACALLLFGVTRRTFRVNDSRRGLATREIGTAAGFAIALLWALHPLQTAAVTYVVQRAEVLVSLFLLLTVYAVVRSVEAGGRQAVWRGVSVASCLCGMATKEVMAGAPILILLYDRAFISGSFPEALRTRKSYYAALGATWLLLGWLVLGSGARGNTAGFGLGFGPWDYARTQIGALVHYLRLVVWPDSLVFDYGGTVLVASLKDVWLQTIILAVLIISTAVALWRNQAAGFLGACFFIILAPSSSVIPVADTMFEHRIYLPLSAVVALLVLAASRAMRMLPLLALIALAFPLGVATHQRNEIYRSEIALWTDTIAKRPANVRAHYTLGSALAEAGQIGSAIKAFEEALRLNSQSPEAHSNFGNVLARLGRLAEARQHYEAALRIRPHSADAHNNLGNVALRQGLIFEAVEHFETALTLKPGFADAHNNLGNVLAQRGRLGDAVAHYEAALRTRPDFADAHLNLANVLAQSGRHELSLPHYAEALRLRPEKADAHYNLAVTLTSMGRRPEALRELNETLRIAPSHEQARALLNQLTQASQ